MSLQGKWLPPGRGVDFYIEMLKRLGRQHYLELGIPPPWAAPKNAQNPHRFSNDFTSFCASKMNPKRSQTRQKTTTLPDLFLQSFFDGSLD